MHDHRPSIQPLTSEQAQPYTRIQHLRSQRKATLLRELWPEILVVYDTEGPQRERWILGRAFRLLPPEEDTDAS